ncbi:MAG: hypothetical protein IPP68_09370 [Elusimicrobia bacterium]|nr:hypothetical protein [Elusimicrobiota bacterium]
MMERFLPLWDNYVELMGDPIFAIASASAVFGGMIFLALAAKFFKAEKAPDLNSLAGGVGPTATPLPVRGPAKSEAVAPAPNATTKLSPPADATKTMVLPPAELPKPAAPPSPGSVDVAMYELLVRRVASLEGEVKKDPLFLDPLLKRLSQMEKRLEEIGELSKKIDDLAKTVAQAPAPVPGASEPGAAPAGGGIDPAEFHAFKEKVYGLQKILEHLAESPGTPPA